MKRCRTALLVRVSRQCPGLPVVQLRSRVACLECTQKAINDAQPYMQAEEDLNEFIEEGGKPS
jgi:hypothetical protein